MAFYPPRFADGPVLTVPDYIVQNVPSVGGGTSGLILLSNATVTSASSVGTVVGDFSVSGGSTRAYSFTLTAGASLFTVTNSTLAVGAALSVGSVAITANATDTGTSSLTGSFLITILSTGVAAFVPTFELLGF